MGFPSFTTEDFYETVSRFQWFQWFAVLQISSVFADYSIDQSNDTKSVTIHVQELGQKLPVPEATEKKSCSSRFNLIEQGSNMLPLDEELAIVSLTMTPCSSRSFHAKCFLFMSAIALNGSRHHPTFNLGRKRQAYQERLAWGGDWNSPVRMS